MLFAGCAIGGCGEDYSWIIFLIIGIVAIALISFLIYFFLKKKKK